MAELTDLDVAAARRLNVALSKMELNVLTVYQQQIGTMITMLLPRLGLERTKSLIEAAMSMVFNDTKAWAAGSFVPMGGVHALYPTFIATHFGGDAQLTFHVCRILLFSFAGVCVPEHEETIRSTTHEQIDMLAKQLGVQ